MAKTALKTILKSGPVFEGRSKTYEGSMNMGGKSGWLHLLILALFMPEDSFSQENFVRADPLGLIQLESGDLEKSDEWHTYDIRPYLRFSPESGYEISSYATARFYYNDNAPNLENTSELWVGRGLTFFTSAHFSFSNRFLYFSIEPYFQAVQNKDYTYYHLNQDPDLNREYIRKFHVLNDGPGRGEDPFSELRLRESQLHLHWKGLGIGVSNAGMWWGPGIHTSLNMTTNTSGLPRIELGTLREQRIRDFGLVARYLFSRLDKNDTEPYYTAIMASMTYYSRPVVTLGGSRSFLSGGNSVQEEISWQDAARLPLQPFWKEKLYDEDSGELPSDKTDQTLSLFLSLLFPESGLKLFMEYGWNDHRWDRYDLRAHPDHSGASIIGFRKYGLFYNPRLYMGFEYANLMKSPYYPQRQTPDWYGRRVFDYSLYDGRRFAAHSGSDSDDMLFYVGYMDKDQNLTLGFNYERHGKIYSVMLVDITGAFHFPENKLELRLDYWRDLPLGRVYFYYEYEFAENLGSPPQGVFPRVENPERKANVFGIGFRTHLFSRIP